MLNVFMTYQAYQINYYSKIAWFAFKLEYHVYSQYFVKCKNSAFWVEAEVLWFGQAHTARDTCCNLLKSCSSHEQLVSPRECCQKQCQRLHWSLDRQHPQLFPHPQSRSPCCRRGSGSQDHTGSQDVRNWKGLWRSSSPTTLPEQDCRI